MNREADSKEIKKTSCKVSIYLELKTEVLIEILPETHLVHDNDIVEMV